MSISLSTPRFNSCTAIANRIQEQGSPPRLSCSLGGFVCFFLFNFLVLQLLTRFPKVRGWLCEGVTGRFWMWRGS